MYRKRFPSQCQARRESRPEAPGSQTEPGAPGCHTARRDFFSLPHSSLMRRILRASSATLSRILSQTVSSRRRLVAPPTRKEIGCCRNCENNVTSAPHGIAAYPAEAAAARMLITCGCKTAHTDAGYCTNCVLETPQTPWGRTPIRLNPVGIFARGHGAGQNGRAHNGPSQSTWIAYRPAEINAE